MYRPHFRKDRNNVPILSKKEIDEIAEGYVLDFCPEAATNPQPLNIDLFIEKYLELTLDLQFLSHNGIYLGMTVFNDTSNIPIFVPEMNQADYYPFTAGTIVIDCRLTEDNQKNRYRYTCGHESGHWVFHRQYYGYNPNQLTFFEISTPYVMCREVVIKDPSKNTYDWDSKRWMEWQADKFSSCLLMPKNAVMNLVKNAAYYAAEEKELISITASTFQVSVEAAKYRLIDLNVIKPDNWNNDQLSLI